MARKTVEKNIAYDDEKKLYYVTLIYGLDKETGKNIKKTETFANVKAARAAHTSFVDAKNKRKIVQPREETLKDFQEFWLETKKIDQRKTTLYNNEQIIKNHINPSALGNMAIQEIEADHILNYEKKRAF